MHLAPEMITLRHNSFEYKPSATVSDKSCSNHKHYIVGVELVLLEARCASANFAVHVQSS